MKEIILHTYDANLKMNGIVSDITTFCDKKYYYFLNNNNELKKEKILQQNNKININNSYVFEILKYNNYIEIITDKKITKLKKNIYKWTDIRGKIINLLLIKKIEEEYIIKDIIITSSSILFKIEEI